MERQLMSHSAALRLLVQGKTRCFGSALGIEDMNDAGGLIGCRQTASIGAVGEREPEPAAFAELLLQFACCGIPKFDGRAAAAHRPTAGRDLFAIRTENAEPSRR